MDNSDDAGEDPLRRLHRADQGNRLWSWGLSAEEAERALEHPLNHGQLLEVVALNALGLDRHVAIEFARLHDLERLRTAIVNACWLDDQGKIKTSRGAYARKCIELGYPRLEKAGDRVRKRVREWVESRCRKFYDELTRYPHDRVLEAARAVEERCHEYRGKTDPTHEPWDQHYMHECLCELRRVHALEQLGQGEKTNTDTTNTEAA